MKITKAILTGGGRATRLRPITTTINKHLIPLANKPMIFHAIEKVIEAGVNEIFINTNPGEVQLQNVVGDGSRWGVKIKYFEQTGGPQGIAHVVNCAKDFIGDDPFIFYLSDNIVLGSLVPFFEKFTSNNNDCMLAFSRVNDPERFGVPVFNEKNELIEVQEKPKNPSNNFAVTGIYLYGPKIFFDAFQHIQKSSRGEFEISDIHSYFLKQGKKVGWEEVTGWWKDTGMPEDLILANKLLLEVMKDDEFSGSNGHKLKIKGRVHLGKELKIGSGVKIIGPVIIGDNCFLEKCEIGPNVTIGSGSTVKNASISESIIFSNCRIEAKVVIKNSIIGDQAKVVKNETKKTHRLIIGDQTLIEL
ncbi:MAG: glucose-1-phosphate thymidylyltransferase [Patescibacteria group bacterium]|jgi:glucose-1-phosphate thymidylyltransferase